MVSLCFYVLCAKEQVLKTAARSCEQFSRGKIALPGIPDSFIRATQNDYKASIEGGLDIIRPVLRCQWFRVPEEGDGIFRMVYLGRPLNCLLR